MITILKNLLLGRPNGLRQKVVQKFFTSSEDSFSSSAGSSEPEVSGGVAYGGSQKMEPPKDVTPPDGYEVVLHRNALQPGEVTEVIIAGMAIAVANVDGEFYAVSNSCPHADGPLSEGELEGCTLTCPYHGWRFDVRDGSGQTNPDFPITTYKAQLKGDAVCVKL